MGIFLGRSRPANTADLGRIWPKSSEILGFSTLDDPIKNEGVKVATRLYIDFSNAQRQLVVVCGGIWPKFELIQAFINLLSPARGPNQI